MLFLIAGWIMTGEVIILGMSLITATLEIHDWWFSRRNGNSFSWKTWKGDRLLHFDWKTWRVLIQDQIHEHKHEKAKWTFKSYMNTKQLHEHTKIKIKKLPSWTWKRYIRLTSVTLQLECNSQSSISNRKTFTNRPVKKTEMTLM